jgi:hypothetical protein
MLPLVTPTDCLAWMWFISLDPHSDRSFLIYHSDFNPFMSAGLSSCDELYWLDYVPFSQVRELFSPCCDGVQYGRLSIEVWTDPLGGHKISYSLHRVASHGCVSSKFEQCREPYYFSFLHGLLNHLWYPYHFGYDIRTKDLAVTCRDQRKRVQSYYDIIHRPDWQWSWQQNLVHGKLSFNCFPYVRTYASRLLLVLLSVQSDRLEYPLLIILRIHRWLSGLTWYGVLANGLDPVDVHPWWSVSD